jgi:hypothetical protein
LRVEDDVFPQVSSEVYFSLGGVYIVEDITSLESVSVVGWETQR